MPIEVRLPELAESMSSATLTAWLKEVGDHVTRGEPIAEVETDKTTVELEAPATGVLEAIQVSAGTADVAVGSVLALLREGAPSGASSPVAPPAAGPDPSRTDVAREPAPILPPGSPAAPAPPGGTVTEAVPTGGGAGAPVASWTLARPAEGAAEAAAEVPATPLARRMAALAELDLATVRGTAADGRIGRADVERALGGSSATPAASARGLQAAAPGPDPPPAAPPALPDLPHRDEPLTAARRVTAARMTQAKRTAPHFYLEVDCEVGRILERLRTVRAAANGTAGAGAPRAPAPDGGGGSGPPPPDLTLTDLMVRATALALAKVPLANSAWTGDAVRVFETTDIAVAVATPAGLVTPVVRDAGAKGLVTLSAELRDLTVRAREGRLQPPEYAGGTFTISNLGMYGVSRLYAILNSPQSCILGVGAIESRPIVRGGEVTAGRTMAVTLSADHRAIDGAAGAAFLRELRAIIEHPDAIFA